MHRADVYEIQIDESNTDIVAEIAQKKLRQFLYSPSLWWPSSCAPRTWLPLPEDHILQTIWLVAEHTHQNTLQLVKN